MRLQIPLCLLHTFAHLESQADRSNLLVQGMHHYQKVDVYCLDYVFQEGLLRTPEYLEYLCN
jgi:hypothetical protein